MRYVPTKTPSDDLSNLDSLHDADLFIDAEPVQTTSKAVRGPSPLNMRANRALPNFVTWILMAGASLILMPFLSTIFEATQNPMRTGMMCAAGGFGLGMVLLWKGVRNDREHVYANIHMFFFISLGLSLINLVPSSLTFLFLGPLLFGFGTGSFLSVLALSTFNHKNLSAARADPAA
jgi:peptidoglycan/LPS O-acetylase OafA/YrhL